MVTGVAVAAARGLAVSLGAAATLGAATTELLVVLAAERDANGIEVAFRTPSTSTQPGGRDAGVPSMSKDVLPVRVAWVRLVPVTLVKMT